MHQPKLHRRTATTGTYTGQHYHPHRRTHNPRWRAILAGSRRTLRLVTEVFGFVVVTSALWFTLLYFAAEAYLRTLVSP